MKIFMTFSVNDSSRKVILLIQESDATGELSDASVVKVIVKDFTLHSTKNEAFQIWSHLLKISVMENFIICVVIIYQSEVST